MGEVDHATRKGGRTTGTSNKAPAVNINLARTAFRGVKARAAQGSPEDQRLVLWLWCGGGLFGGPIAFDPSKPATPLDPNAQTTLLQRPTEEARHAD